MERWVDEDCNGLLNGESMSEEMTVNKIRSMLKSEHHMQIESVMIHQSLLRRNMGESNRQGK